MEDGPDMVLERSLSVDDDLGCSDDEDIDGRPMPKKRKGKSTRWKIPSNALQMLEQVFLVDKFPSVETRKQLATNLKVTPRQVQVWFQNKRQRAVRPKSPDPSGSLTSTDDVRAALLSSSNANGSSNSNGNSQSIGNHSGVSGRGAVDATLQQRDVFADEAAVTAERMLPMGGMPDMNNLADVWMAAAAMQMRQMREAGAQLAASGLGQQLTMGLDPSAFNTSALAGLWGQAFAGGMPGMPPIPQLNAIPPPSASASAPANPANAHAGANHSGKGQGATSPVGWPSGWPQLPIASAASTSAPHGSGGTNGATAATTASTAKSNPLLNGDFSSAAVPPVALGLPLSAYGVGHGDRGNGNKAPDVNALLAQASAAAAASLADANTQSAMLEQVQHWTQNLGQLSARDIAMLLPQGMLGGLQGGIPAGGLPGVKLPPASVAHEALGYSGDPSVGSANASVSSAKVGTERRKRERSGRAEGDELGDTAEGGVASGERQESDPSVVAMGLIQQAMSSANAGMGGAMGNSVLEQALRDNASPPQLLDPANLQAYLAAQAHVPFSVTAAPVSALKAEAALMSAMPMGGPHAPSTVGDIRRVGDITRGSSCSDLTSTATSSSSVAERGTAVSSNLAASMGMGVAPGSHTPLPTTHAANNNAHWPDDRWQRALQASQDWSNVLRMAGLRQEMTNQQQQHRHGVSTNNAFANLAAVNPSLVSGTLAQLFPNTASGCQGDGSATSASMASVVALADQMNPAMNPAMSHHSRSASEQLLADLTTSTQQQQQQRRSLPPTLNTGPSQEGSMDDLIDSLFPFTDDMHQQLNQQLPFGTNDGGTPNRVEHGHEHDERCGPIHPLSSTMSDPANLADSGTLPSSHSSSNLADGSDERATMSVSADTHSDGTESEGRKSHQQGHASSKDSPDHNSGCSARGNVSPVGSSNSCVQ